MAFVTRSERKILLCNPSNDLGPGTYIGPASYKRITNFVPFSSSSEKSQSKSFFTPGPGSYLELFPKARPRLSGGFSSAFASNSSRFDSSKPPNPGPGSYNVKQDWSPKKLQQKIDNTMKWVRLPSAPSIPRLGYGYEETPNGELVIHEGPAVIGGDQKESVGPGHYNPKLSTSNNAVKWKNGSDSRNTFINKSESPGPGSYALNNSEPRFKVKPNAVFVSGSKRATDLSVDVDEASSVPGPGRYNYRTSITPSLNPYLPQNFGSYVKRFMSVSPDDHQIGPGSYNIQGNKKIKNIEAKVPFSSNIARFQDKSNISPGPGFYYKDEREKKVWGKAGVFGCTEERFVPDKNKIPGPGSYAVEDKTSIHSSQFNKGSSAFLSKSKRMASDSPGKVIPPPGFYELPETFTKQTNKAKPSPFNAQSERFAKDQKNASPSPWSYNIKKPSEIKSIITSKETRFKNLESVSPGPGFYKEPESWNKKTFNALFDNK